MSTSAIQFIQVSPEQLQSEITQGVKAHLDEFLKNFKPQRQEDYLTRQEVASMFKVDISTIANWQKNGKLKPYALSGRIYFLRSEIEQALIPIT